MTDTMRPEPTRFSVSVAVIGLTSALLTLAGGVLTQTAQAQTYNQLYTFPSLASGAEPTGNLILVGNSLYGTTTTGGGPSNSGTVYQFDIKTGQQTVLHSFAGPPSDGSLPYAGLIVDPAGNLYGTTNSGGSNNLGTVFKLSSTGTLTLLHSFSGPDGAHPFGGLARDGKGALYGTTIGGGITSTACLTNIGGNACGTVFKLDAAGKFTLLHRFTGSPDGANPYSNVLLDAGNIYGTTADGGAFNQGTVYQINAVTGVEDVLHSFTGGADGKDPMSGLIEDGKGNLYGTTVYGPQTDSIGVGVVFMINIAARTETVLHSFNAIDGAEPSGTLAMGLQGNLYGTTWTGAVNNNGNVFELNPKSGRLTVLHNFQSGADGAFPDSGLVRDSQGNFYGSTYEGGTPNLGTIFKITP